MMSSLIHPRLVVGIKQTVRNAFCTNATGRLFTREETEATTDTTTDTSTLFSERHKLEVLKSGRLNTVSESLIDVANDVVGKSSSVLIPLCHVDGQPAILFIQRSKHLKLNGGDVSFPGGVKDSGDPDLIHTALRETYEEIGLPQDQVNVWGTLNSIPSSMSFKKGHIVTPVVSYCGEIDVSNLKINHSEVELIFTETVATLIDQTNIRQTQMRTISKFSPNGYTTPVYLVQHKIWGVTALMLHYALQAIIPETYKFEMRLRT